MPLPTITMSGTVVAEPMVRFTAKGDPVTTLRVAANDRRKNESGEWENADTIYLDVVAWRKAEEIANACPKGTRVLVTGTLKQRTYTGQDGNERVTVQVQAAEIAPLVTALHVYGKADNTDNPWQNPHEEAPF